MIGAVSADNDDGANSNNIIFYYKRYKILGSRRHFISKKKKKKLSKVFSKRFQRSVHWNKCKIKSENKNATKEHRYFLESNFVGVDRLLVSIYSNLANDAQIIVSKSIIYQNIFSKTITPFSTERTSMINSYILI